MYAVEVIGLSHFYPDGTQALKDVNLTVQEGTKIAILGPNGSGKSTLFYHLNGLFLPQNGKVIIKGEEITKKNIDWVRRCVGLVFQDSDDQLFAPTVYDDIAFGPRNLGLPEHEVEKRVKNALEMFGIKEYEKRNPDNLSGGEKKKAAVAGVLAMEPNVLVFDEPTAGLDPSSTVDIIEIMDELNTEGKSIIISTHDVDMASTWADEIYLLKKGEVYSSGKPEEIFGNMKALRQTKLTFPTIIKTHREFEAHNIYEKREHLPFSILDLVDNINAKTDKNGGSIWVAAIPGMKQGGVGAVKPDKLKKVFDIDPDRVGAMGTSAKASVRMLGIHCDFESDIINSSLSEAVMGKTVVILASGNMADLVIEKVNQNNEQNNRKIMCKKLHWDL